MKYAVTPLSLVTLQIIGVHNGLAEWCTEKNLLLIVSKIKELLLILEKKKTKKQGGKDTHTLVYISGVEFLGQEYHISLYNPVFQNTIQMNL